MEQFQSWIPKIQEFAAPFGLQLLKAVAIFIIGRWVVKLLASIAEKLMRRSRVDEMLVKFLRNIIYSVLLVFVVIAAINSLGIQTASLVAVIGAAGLAIGLALQGSLSNFAAGVLTIVFRPYTVGDIVEIAGKIGKVEEVEVFTTVLRMPDKTKVIIPNGKIMSGIIVNFTDQELRRLEAIIGIGYGDDIDAARAVILTVLAECPLVKDEPAPTVTVAALGDSSVNLAVRCWVEATSFGLASHDVNERIKKALDANGINIPFPQRDVHLYQHTEK